MDKADYQFFGAITQFFNSGGTVERAHALVDQAAAETGKAGHASVAQQGHAMSAGLSHHTPSEGQTASAHQGPPVPADARPPIPDDGQYQRAHQGQQNVAVVGTPKPSEGHLKDAHQSHKLVADARSPLPAGHSAYARQGHNGSASGQTARGEATRSLPEQGHDAHASPRDPNEKFRQALIRDRMQTAAIWLERTKTSDGRYWSKVHPREFIGMERDAEVIRHIRLLYGEFSPADQNKELGQILSPDLIKKLAYRMEKYNASV